AGRAFLGRRGARTSVEADRGLVLRVREGVLAESGAVEAVRLRVLADRGGVVAVRDGVLAEGGVVDAGGEIIASLRVFAKGRVVVADRLGVDADRGVVYSLRDRTRAATEVVDGRLFARAADVGHCEVAGPGGGRQLGGTN